MVKSLHSGDPDVIGLELTLDENVISPQRVSKRRTGEVVFALLFSRVAVSVVMNGFTPKTEA